MNELAVSVIQEYINKYLFEPRSNWPMYEFNVRSYSRWAANEIIGRIQNDSDRSPVNVISEFIREVDLYSEKTPTNQSQLIFSVAKETAIDIILLFL